MDKQIQDAVYDYIMSPDDGEARLAPTNAVLEITTPDTVTINVAAVVYLKEGTIREVQDRFKTELQAYLLNVSSDATDNVVRISAINSLLSSISDIYDYENVQINDAAKNVEFTSGQMPVLGTIALTEG